MLIAFSTAVKKYGMNPTGIINVGSHHAEEYEMLKSLGINYFVMIEPCQKAWNVLQEKFGKINADPTNSTTVSLFNRALADYEGEAEMFTETINGGQSNSLLEPKKHLEQHPSIVFTGKETVRVSRLDDLDLDFAFPRQYLNTLFMDVQGAEMLVLKGAIETLKQIQIIYTEVNRTNVYEGCALVNEIDEFLWDQGFEDLEEKWVGGWGDKIFRRRKN